MVKSGNILAVFLRVTRAMRQPGVSIGRRPVSRLPGDQNVAPAFTM
jgi:hypothetical protein